MNGEGMATDKQPPSDVRKSALWGTGNRGGEHRSSALWGRGGRGAVTALVASFVLLAPIAAFAGGGNGSGGGEGSSGETGAGTYVQPGLLDRAKGNGDQKLHVIVQSVAGVGDATSKVTGLGSIRQQLNLIGAVAIDVTAGKLATLAKQPGLVITPDSPVHSSGSTAAYTSNQMWPYETGVATLWGTTLAPAPSAPTIAVVDSGLDAGRTDFSGRAYPQVNLDSRNAAATGDQRGHGTFVAGIAAGGATGYAGAAPNAKILPIRVIDAKGVALTSDVISACQWILANKAAYNIRVANFSLHAGTATHFYFDPLDRAVEKLWFSGITVVAAAGNYGLASGPSGVVYSPGNDPFVITVGAVDLGNSVGLGNDTAPSWSAYGYTEDGFSKPELGAPGRYMIGPVPAGSTLPAEKPGNVVGPGYMQLSGTSFAAPAVAGAAAQLLARHPGWTPDQVKGALMLTAKPAPNAPALSVGVGELNAGRAASLTITPPNPNKAAEQFVKVDSLSGGATFDYTGWATLAHANASWNDASWADASWADASWNDASWADASWNDASWADASWADASWADASWADASWADSTKEDAAEGDAASTPPLVDAQALADIQSDPDLALPTDPIATSTVTSSTSTVTSSTSTAVLP
jgi:serine protease AprX